MNKALWTKKALIVPTVAALTLGGISLSAIPANAAAADLTVTSNTVTAARVLTVSGKATPGDNIELLTPSGDFAVPRTSVPASGDYTFAYTIPATVASGSTYKVQQLVGLNDDGSLPVTVTIPAAAPSNALTLDTPTEGSTTTSRTVTFSGTAPANSVVSVTQADGTVTKANGGGSISGTTYSVPVTFSNTATAAQTVTISSQAGGRGADNTVTRDFTLPAVAPSNTLTLDTPTEGSTTASRTVTFTGTAPANSVVSITQADGTVTKANGGGSITGTTYSVDVPFSDTAATAQTVTVSSVAGGRGADDTVTRDFTLPAAAPVSTNELTLDSPLEGSTTASRTVTFTGSAPAGSIVSITQADGTVTKSNGSITGTTYSIPVTFDNSAAAAQTVTVSSFAGGRGADNTVTRDFTLPAAVIGANELTLDTPIAGSTTASRTVTFTGSAPATSIVSITLADGTVVRSDGSITGTTYSIPVTFADSAATSQTVTVSSFAGGRGADNTVTRTFNLPAAVTQTIATPVITSPKNGDKLTGSQVTFTGTGTPGANIVLAIVPTSDLTAADMATLVSPSATPAAVTPAAPTDPIVVDADGNWTVTLALTPNDYTAEAESVLLNADGTPVVDANGDPLVSDPSNDVEFTLAAAAVTTTAATGTGTPISAAAADPASGSLAFTGSNTAPVAGFAGLLLALGGVLAFFGRRRRSTGMHSK